jgi:hypothetical protein
MQLQKERQESEQERECNRQVRNGEARGRVGGRDHQRSLHEVRWKLHFKRHSGRGKRAVNISLLVQSGAAEERRQCPAAVWSCKRRKFSSLLAAAEPSTKSDHSALCRRSQRTGLVESQLPRMAWAQYTRSKDQAPNRMRQGRAAGGVRAWTEALQSQRSSRGIPNGAQRHSPQHPCSTAGESR